MQRKMFSYSAYMNNSHCLTYTIVQKYDFVFKKLYIYVVRMQ